ncbi:hypothetical protein LZ009_10370 [Ramlibacter sp. XY19]|uniref:hypothetical protein n=1 Tax=Ramlibacter paludis TaxID=2908000 RepID=UPI0023DB2D71|nr:hypothetical protein [Ramlibacter paludis]MCG2593184.1 hypothetical protein [Ramlibacter paludis]
MPIHIDEVDTQVDIQTSEQATEPPRSEPKPDALPRWQQMARRDAELALRTSAWGFED